MGNSWGLTLFLTQLPTYMKNVLGFSIKANGALSALPFLSRYTGAVGASTLSDWLVQHHHLSLINTRRIFSILAMWVPAVVVIGVAYGGCQWEVTVALICLALFFNGAITTSVIVNSTDIAPNLSGTLFGISNTFASIISFIVPVVTGLITNHQETLAQWRKVFWVCVPMYTLTEIFYLIFVSSNVQPWNFRDQSLTTGDDAQETSLTTVKHQSYNVDTRNQETLVNSLATK
ncbi:putative inorganic phosphate cotransporter [Cherax quadricarinatus]